MVWRILLGLCVVAMVFMGVLMSRMDDLEDED